MELCKLCAKGPKGMAWHGLCLVLLALQGACQWVVSAPWRTLIFGPFIAYNTWHGLCHCNGRASLLARSLSVGLARFFPMLGYHTR